MLVDNGFPPFLWGELMVTASCQCNRIPRSTLKIETPHKMLDCKDADLSHLRIIDGRAFVDIKDATKLGHTSWEIFRVWNLKSRLVVESRNAIFIETSPQEDFAATGTGSSIVSVQRQQPRPQLHFA